MDVPSSTTQNDGSASSVNTDIQIPSSLKFVMSNMRNMITIQLTNENFHLWKPQVVKIFSANGFLGFIDGSATPPRFLDNEIGIATPNSAYTTWILLDQNLSATLFVYDFAIHLTLCLES